MAITLSRRTVVTVESETTYNDGTTPALADDALLVFGDGASVYTQATNIVDNPALRASLTPQKALVGRTMATVNIGTYLMTASKATDTAGETSSRPFFSNLLKACGWSEAIGDDGSTSSSTVYTPVSSAIESCAIWVYADTALHKIDGCYGSFTLTMNAGGAPDLQFTMMGIYNDPIAGSTSGAAYPVDDKVLVENEQITIGAFSPVVRSVTLNWATTVSERADANDQYGFAGVQLTDRSPTLTIVVEQDALGTFDPWADLYATPSKSISFTHSTSATEDITLSVTNPQLTNVTRSSDGGVNTLSLEYRLWSNTDDGEATLTFAKAV